MDQAWLVRAPIRYGRLSDGGTYTMIFTQLADHQLGQAKVVQCRHPVTTSADLITEAEWLWSAEHNKVPRLCTSTPEHSISASWGCVALLRNAHSNVPQALVDDWAKRVSEEKASGGKHLVDSRGMLQIEWPSTADGSGPVPMDLLLATSNNPKPTGSDLSVRAIAAAWKAKGDTYFRRNRDNGISTFQDQEIEALLR